MTDGHGIYGQGKEAVSVDLLSADLPLQHAMPGKGRGGTESEEVYMNDKVTPGLSRGVLIVEDEAVISADLKIIVESLGYMVSGIVRTGKDALDFIASRGDDVALILMDISLRGNLDGIDTISRINAKHTPAVIYVTGHSDDDTIKKAMKYTAPYAIISKPFTPELMESTIQGAMDPLMVKKADKVSDPSVDVLPGSWENAGLTVKGNEEQVTLKKISRSSVWVLTDIFLHSHIKYPVTLSLSKPWGEIQGLAWVIDREQDGPDTLYKMKVIFDVNERYAWEEYIRHRLDSGAH